jgi:hypothetical protein
MIGGKVLVDDEHSLNWGHTWQVMIAPPNQLRVDGFLQNTN